MIFFDCNWFLCLRTRVVQKLIESLKTRKQTSLIIRALEPGFLDLIKDLNGNHVVQRCLLCLSSDDNKVSLHQEILLMANHVPLDCFIRLCRF